MKKISFEKLLKFSENLFLKANLDLETAKAVSFGLCETSLRGVDSHGIRLIPHYINSAIKGRKNPRPNYKQFPDYQIMGRDWPPYYRDFPDYQITAKLISQITPRSLFTGQ